MSRESLLFSNARRLATEMRTHEGNETHFQSVSPVAIGIVPTYAGRFLRNAGSEDMNVDGSTTAVAFKLEPGSDEVLRVLRLRLVIEHATAGELGEFGDAAALTNGIALAHLDADDAAIVDLLDGERIKTTLDLAVVCSSLEVLTGASSYATRATFDFPVPLRIGSDDNGGLEELRLTVADNLTGLTRMRAFVEAWDEGALR